MGNNKTAGYSLIELIVVVAIVGTMLGIAGFSFHEFQKRYAAESQVRIMHIDMLRARHRAFQLDKSYFVTVSADSYQITEDTNDSGGTKPDGGDTPIWPEPKRFRYRSLWGGTVILTGRGTISKSGGGILSTNPLPIIFDTAGTEPEYDCIAVAPTRINVGKWNDIKCVPR